MSFEIRICPVCTSLVRQPNVLCPSCFNIFKTELSKVPSGPILQNGLRIYPLLIWQKSGSFFVDQLIYSLKGGRGFPHVFKWLATVFEAKMDLSRQPKLLICPPKRPMSRRGPDHAQLWTQSLAMAHRQSISLSPFSVAEDPAQKGKNLRERRKTSAPQKRKVFVRGSARCFRHRQVIFCDDVCSSGSTAKASLKAYGAPLKSVVWCVAYRAKNNWP